MRILSKNGENLLEVTQFIPTKIARMGRYQLGSNVPEEPRRAVVQAAGGPDPGTFPTYK
jgi:hypothetical protein